MRNPCEHISPLDDYGKCEINANIIYPFAHSSIYLFFEIVLPGRTFSLPPLSLFLAYKIRTKKEQKSNDNYHLIALRNSLSLELFSFSPRTLPGVEELDTWRCFRSARWTANIFKHVFNFKYRSWRKLSPFEYLTRFIGADFTKVKKKKSRRTFPASQGCIFPRESVYKSEERRGK